MSADVPVRRPTASEADVVTGRAVRARTTLTEAQLVNWTLGQGDVLVPGYDPDQSIAAGASKTFVYRVTPNGRAVRRTWRVYLIAATRSGTVAITAGAASPVTVPVPVASATAVPITVTEDLASKSGALQTLTLVIANDASSGTVVCSGIECHEAPRARLAAADLGIDDLTERARATIDCRDNASLGGLMAAHEAMRGTGGVARRVSYLGYARPANTTDAWSDATGAFVPVLTAGHILARKINHADTTGTVRWYFYVSASTNATNGEIRITNNTTAATATATYTNAGDTTWHWITVDSSDFACEDLTEASGLAGGVFSASTFRIEMKQTGAAGTFYCSSACGEEP